MIDLQKLDDTTDLMVGLTTHDSDLLSYSDTIGPTVVSFLLASLLVLEIFLAVTTVRLVYKLIKKLYGRFV